MTVTKIGTVGEFTKPETELVKERRFPFDKLRVRYVIGFTKPKTELVKERRFPFDKLRVRYVIGFTTSIKDWQEALRKSDAWIDQTI